MLLEPSEARYRCFSLQPTTKLFELENPPLSADRAVERQAGLAGGGRVAESIPGGGDDPRVGH